MSILSVAKDHRPSPALGVRTEPPRKPAHRLVRLALGVLVLAAALGAALAAATRGVVGLAARVGRWFAAEPRRIRVALVALGSCLIVGTTIGLTAGFLMTRLADAALALIRHTMST